MGDLPERFPCLNPGCTRSTPLPLEDYMFDAGVPEGVPPDEVHRRVRPGAAPFTILCTCGHFTVVSRGAAREG